MLARDYHHSPIDSRITFTFCNNKTLNRTLFRFGSIHVRQNFTFDQIFLPQSFLCTTCRAHIQLVVICLYSGVAITAVILMQSHVCNFHVYNPYISTTTLIICRWIFKVLWECLLCHLHGWPSAITINRN